MASKRGGSGPRPTVGKLIGGSKPGGKNNKNFKGGITAPPNVNMLSPALSGNADVVQQRTAEAIKGVQEKTQLKKNKSTGIRVGGIGRKK